MLCYVACYHVVLGACLDLIMIVLLRFFLQLFDEFSAVFM